MPFKKAILGVVFLFVAEVLASMLVWSGSPTDSNWEPSFWSFEISRLLYWATFASIAVTAALLVSHGIARLKWGKGGRGKTGLALAFCGLLALATEYLTSVYYWRSLPSSIASYVGWSYRPRYISDHLWSWAFSLAFLLFGWFIWRRRRAQLVPEDQPR